MKYALRLLILLSVTTTFSGHLMAQTFPTKPVRVIVGFPVGTAVDVVTRALAVHMQKQLGQPLIVEARAGAGGIIAVNAVIKAEPDGHTIHFGVLGGLIPALVKDNPVDAKKDLAPISDSLTSPFVFYSSTKLPIKSLQELVVYSKANPPGKLNFASSTGQVEMMMQIVKNSSGITYTLINYPGAPAVIPALITGEVAIHMNVFGPFLPHIDSGTIRALFISAPKRMAQFPGVPTAAEVGIPNVESATIDIGFWAPKDTPRDVVDKLSRSAISAVHMPDIADLFQKQGYVTVGSTPEAQLQKYEATRQFWTNAARVTNFQPQ